LKCESKADHPLSAKVGHLFAFRAYRNEAAIPATMMWLQATSLQILDKQDIFGK
jgi:hypothetical protein